MQWNRRLACAIAMLYAIGPLVFAQAPSQATAGDALVNSKIWVGRAGEFETFLKTAEIVRMADIPVGVTKPRRAWFAPGGLFESMAWKVIPPGRPSGFWESYKSEIAAYELDKLLGLDMVPPTVERRVKGDLGAAVMWVSPTKSFKDLGGAPTPPPARAFEWSRQLVKAKMFDNLIANKDPNLGNWLVDPAWNLILIDHSRSFVPGKDMFHELTRIDAPLWEKMKALTEESLTTALKPWLDRGSIRGMLERRDRMQQIIDKLVAKQGEAAVMIR